MIVDIRSGSGGRDATVATALIRERAALARLRSDIAAILEAGGAPGRVVLTPLAGLPADADPTRIIDILADHLFVPLGRDLEALRRDSDIEAMACDIYDALRRFDEAI